MAENNRPLKDDLGVLIDFLNIKGANVSSRHFQGVDEILIHQAAEHIRVFGDEAMVWDEPIKTATSAALIILC